MTNDTKATGLGLIAGGSTIAQVDWNKFIQLDYTEVGRFVVGIAFILWGWVTNRVNRP